MSPVPRVFVAVGSNVDPEDHVPQAVRLLAARLGPLRTSTFYRTAPLGWPGQPRFYNGVVEGWTALPPLRLKWHVLRGIETRLGRVRTADRFAPRTIDLDLLLHGEHVVATPALRLPDPDIAARPFLAVPLHELAPDLVLPGSRLRVADLAARADRSGMVPLEAFSRFIREASGPAAPPRR